MRHANILSSSYRSCGINVGHGAHIAQRLEVSERTIYRDIQDLSLCGLPVQGEAVWATTCAIHSISRR